MRKLMAIGLLGGTAIAAPIGAGPQAAILTGSDVEVSLLALGTSYSVTGTTNKVVDGVNTVGGNGEVTLQSAGVTPSDTTLDPDDVFFYFDFYESGDMVFFEMEANEAGEKVAGTDEFQLQFKNLDFKMGYELVGNGILDSQLSHDFGGAPVASIEDGGSSLYITFDDNNFVPDTNTGVIISGMFEIAQSGPTAAIPLPAPILFLLSGIAVIAGIRRFA